jgi:hypothetical protein
MILICYDGSQDAKAAIEHAGDLLRSEPAAVLTVHLRSSWCRRR